MKLLIDMNLSPRWIPFLTSQGWDAVHWSAVGDPKATDSEIMAFAANGDFVVLTYDLDFSAILAATHGEKPSVVQLRIDDTAIRTAGPRVLTTLKQMEPELSHGAVVTIDEDRVRVRLLPLKRP